MSDKKCVLCDDTTKVHDKTCDCFCHTGEQIEVTSQWNVPNNELNDLIDASEDG